MQDLFVRLLIGRLALWQEFTMDNAQSLRRLLNGARFESVESIKKGRNDGAGGHPRIILPAMHRIVAEKAGKVPSTGGGLL